MKVFFSVGEPSGDLHGANLIRELRSRDPHLQCVGYGGPRMAAAGCQLHEDLTQLAVMWLLSVLVNIHRFWVLYQRAGQYFRDERPDAVVLIDYPGFNWWIARSAKRHQIPVIYYGVPQMWAWAGWRVKKMRRLVDHVLCKLPFEAAWFQQRGCHATYVGHPYFDEVSQRQLNQEIVQSLRGDIPLVTILPGSRTKEVIDNLPWFLLAATKIRKQVPKARFAIAAFNEKQASIARELVRKSEQSIEVHVGRTPELIEAAFCCVACSGSVSLELMYHEKPTVILYFASRLGHLIWSLFIQVRYITLVNLLATDDISVRNRFQVKTDSEVPPFPEYVASQDPSARLASHVIEWLTCPAAYRQRVAQLQKLKDQFAQPGASAATASYILSQIQPPSTKRPAVPPPHFEVRGAA